MSEIQISEPMGSILIQITTLHVARILGTASYPAGAAVHGRVCCLCLLNAHLLPFLPPGWELLLSVHSQLKVFQLLSHQLVNLGENSDTALT